MSTNLKAFSNNKVSFLSVLAVFVLFGLVFASGEFIINSPSNAQVNINSNTLINFSFNNTGFGDHIFLINITWDPQNATFVLNSNVSEKFQTAPNFENITNSSIIWRNSTNGGAGSVIDDNNTGTFLFNISVPDGVASGTVLQLTITTIVQSQIEENAGNVSYFNLTLVSSDSTAPIVFNGNITSPSSGTNNTGSIVLNVSVADASSPIGIVFFNITNSSGVQNATITASNLTASHFNATLNTSHFPDGTYNITVYANDTAGNLNNSALVHTIKFDNTNPSATASCSPTSIQTGDSFPCTCSTSDATSGVQTSSSSSTSSDGTSTPSTTGTFTYTCSATDYVGKTASSTATYTVNQPPSGSTGTTASAIKTSTISNAKTGIPTELTISLDSIETIVITPSTDLASISIIAKDLGSNKPSSIPEAPIETVHKYLELTSAQSSNFQKAEITFKVENSALTDKTAVLNRYAENAWNKLTTEKVSSDGTHTTFKAETPGFSVFAITLEEAVTPETPEQPTQPDHPTEPEQPITQPEPMNILLIVGVVVVVIVVLVAVSIKMKSSPKKKK